MNTQDELREKHEFERKALRRARITSIVLGLSAVLTVIFMLYGFTQSIEATKQREMAQFEKERSTQESNVLKEQLAKCEADKATAATK